MVHLRDLIPNLRFLYQPIPSGNVNRSGIPMTARRITIHENGNPNPGADALAEMRFTHAGGGPDTASYHFAVSSVDGVDTIVQLLPLNEVGWHAGDGYNGPGNRTSIAIEHCQWGDFERTLKLGQSLCAALLTNPEQFAPFTKCTDFYVDLDVALVQHNFWTGKNCPQYIRARGLWGAYKQGVEEAMRPKPLPFTYTGLDYQISAPWGGRLTFRAVHRFMKTRRETPIYKIDRTGLVQDGELPRGHLVEVFYVGKINNIWYYRIGENAYVPELAFTHRVRVFRNV